MPRKKWSQEIAGGALPVDLTVNPYVAGDAQDAAEWVELPGGGTLTYLDGSGHSQTITGETAGYTTRITVRKLVSLSGASPNLVRVGTGEGPTEPDPDASAATSATNAATSASAAATSATNAGTSATNAAASAVTAAGYGLAPSATVITADPAPAVIGTLYVCNPSGGAFSVALPAIGSGNHGKRIGFSVSTTSANAVTPVPNGTDTLPGGFTSVSGAYGFATLEADNTPTPKVWRRVG